MDDTQPTEPTPTPQAPVVPDNAKWYVVHTYSGHENKVATNLKQRIETMKLAGKIFDIIVPTRNIVLVRHGKKRRAKRKNLPRLHIGKNGVKR